MTYFLYWILPLAGGFVVGGILFLSMKVQVDYVIKKKGAEWIVPAAMYARMIFIAAILIVMAKTVDREHILPVAMMGLAGTIVARVLVGRMVKRGADDDVPENDAGESDK